MKFLKRFMFFFMILSTGSLLTGFTNLLIFEKEPYQVTLESYGWTLLLIIGVSVLGAFAVDVEKYIVLPHRRSKRTGEHDDK
ncbi:hypothetical protein GGR21_003131 [Dysgonomonas hofstadii]|uniref:Uncharacterized protein n=1 Tax=Dysgonomonas hofstadii TaxID=637886 RepID=A0A840CU45_9BACT|nr:hypothetical protein [Dysgonomonas hofstadii]MBB4037214.1 hypothetical protein [Dysgonomonas hofstadii]